MSEEPMGIRSGNVMLEALLSRSRSGDAALLCHPHPLYGGSMHNNVIAALQKTLAEAGWTTLRFNFRGVGGSGGQYADGEGEMEDLLAAASSLIEDIGARRVHLVGYSFGAWVALRAVRQGFQPASLFLISPPVQFLDFSGLKLPPKPCLITLGDHDDFCSVPALRRWLSEQPSGEGGVDLGLLPQCDHFYGSREALLSREVSDFIRRHFQTLPG